MYEYDNYTFYEQTAQKLQKSIFIPKKYSFFYIITS